MTESRGGRAEPAGRRERRKLLTRGELLLAGRRLFGEKGLYEARIEDLTGRAGIAKGTLYTYFRDKDELIRAVVAEGFRELAARLARRVGRARSLRDVARRAVRAHLEFFEEHPDLTRILHQSRGMLKFDRPAWRPLRISLNGYLETLAGALAQAPAVARLREAERLELARLLYGALSGVISVRASAAGPRARPRPPTAAVEGLVSMVEAYVAAAGR